ncbi:uncharacterized protein LOC130613323 [Hydractinia symbiolongicarpus]|uniref:uncharacterized protein LOC130613323 n=1 Tax=Hydractinia symbiolongicarpus TaxID=13093 RepID=UPI00254AE3B7|nr:uncharacterized protein LOC130613323 [Hydractinia symbiolongicarpus]XP_057290656.1 uncharacterized protein LOC130613323 [Hydractinia symbiolongicarpus]XP_057290657.1 uncharacterized protein LOC130613323 [Hydractinia symbiolongicarpus]
MDLTIWLALFFFNVIEGTKNTSKENHCSVFQSQLQSLPNKTNCLQLIPDVSNLKQVCHKYHATCKGFPHYRGFTTKLKGRHLFVIGVNMTAISKELRKDCWGVTLHTSGEDLDKCEYKSLDQGYEEFKFQYSREQEYTFSMTLLPTGETKDFSWTSPDDCALSVLEDIQSVIHNTHGSRNYCFKKQNVASVMTFAKIQCKKHDYSATRVKDILKNNLHVTSECEFLLNKDTANSTSMPVLTIAIISISVVLILLLSVACFVVRHRKKLHRNTQDYHETLRIVEPITSDNESTSVMILNRPGCELLEAFLRDFAFVLSSYGVNVRMALLEQNEIDADGGIASYMQKHINKCDYILIMCTENTNEHIEILKHRPYEFALKIIGGMAFHQNDSSRYIPMYLSSYKEAVKIIPSFLNASTSFGYQLPQDMKKLLSRITSKKQLQATSERIAKDKFFFNKMYEHRKKISAKEHPHCIKEYCTKGTCHGSIVNLSSIWPTTVQSAKWSSSHSLANDPLDDVIKESTSYEMTLVCKYNLMIGKDRNICEG